ncbi:hypothetical protein F66182_53 [Fusarium sp. NRRL 66182]|nr:hypothetical protein F66182_53 [Fusarium sp. NRRL 66182]
MSGVQEERKQVCDNCRFRKVKCDRGLPCKNCHMGDLRCQYRHSIRRKGPKQGHGRRQAQLRQGLGRFDANQFQILTTTDSTSGPGLPNRRRETTGHTHTQANIYISPSFPASQAADSGQHGGSQPAPCGTDTADGPMLDAQDLSNRLSLSLVAHVRLFQRFLFPIMPVVDDDVLADAARLDELPPSRYAFILALCAATRLQLRMDKRFDDDERELEAEIPSEPRLTADMLVSLAENSLRQYSVIEDTTLDSVLASFFLFASYGNADDARHAWFYLNQSITLAQALDITREAGYYGFPEVEREKRRRVFWLLFVTERTFALQHRRSVMLRSTVTKPQIVDSDCPVVMHDFINHIRLFESLPYTLYEWQPEGDDGRFEDLKLVHTINDKLCSVQPDQSVIESQRFDTLITQQWLRISMWRIAFGQKPSSASSFGLLLPPALPMDAGKVIMSALGSVGSKSKDCHGIGMEQKLFDVGISLADSALIPGWTCSALENGPRHLLSVVIHALSAVRGTQSHLLPNLLKYSEGLFTLPDPNAHLSLSWEIPDAQDYNENAVVEEVSTSEDEAPDALTWVPDDNLDLFDLSTPVVTSAWEDTNTTGQQFNPEVAIPFD